MNGAVADLTLTGRRVPGGLGSLQGLVATFQAEATGQLVLPDPRSERTR